MKTAWFELTPLLPMKAPAIFRATKDLALRIFMEI